MLTDLHAEILAAIEYRERIATGAGTAARSAAWRNTADPLGYHVESSEYGLGRLVLRAGEDMGLESDESARVAKHIAANDPATVLRGLAEDRDILARHKPSEFVTIWERGQRYPQCTHGCPDEEDELPADAVRWDGCADVLSLARRHGIEVPA